MDRRTKFSLAEKLTVVRHVLKGIASVKAAAQRFGEVGLLLNDGLIITFSRERLG